MPLSPSSLLVGSHAYFWQDGQPFTSPAPGTSGRNLHADAADPGWADRYLGIVGTCTIQSARGEGVEVWAPSPGRLRLYEVLPAKSDIVITYGLQQLTALCIQLLFGTSALDKTSTQWNPTEGPGRVNGWIKHQQYDQNNVLRTVADLYCSVSIPENVTFDPAALAEVTIEARLLTASLNTGTL
jgi:hypothetical protein